MPTQAGSRPIPVLALAALLALAACGGSSKPPTASPPPPPPTPGEKPAADEACQQAVDVLFAVTAAGEAPDIRARSAKVFVARCEADRWSAEVRHCLVGVKAAEDADKCEVLLTPEQRTELRDELARELDAAGVRPEVRSGRSDNARPAKGAAPPPSPAKDDAAPPPPAPAADKKKAAPPKKPAASKASKGRADPCEGGE